VSERHHHFFLLLFDDLPMMVRFFEELLRGLLSLWWTSLPSPLLARPAAVIFRLALFRELRLFRCSGRD
jgi:hypothetical protein